MTTLWYPKQEQAPPTSWAVWEVSDRRSTDTWLVAEVPALTLRGSHGLVLYPSIPRMYGAMRVGDAWADLHPAYLPEFLGSCEHALEIHKVRDLPEGEAERLADLAERRMLGRLSAWEKSHFFTTEGTTQCRSREEWESQVEAYRAHPRPMGLERLASRCSPDDQPFPAGSWERWLVDETATGQLRHPPYTSLEEQCAWGRVSVDHCWGVRAPDWRPIPPEELLEEAQCWASGREIHGSISAWKGGQGRPTPDAQQVLSVEDALTKVNSLKLELDLVFAGDDQAPEGGVWVAALYDAKTQRLRRSTVFHGQDLARTVSAAVAAGLV